EDSRRPLMGVEADPGYRDFDLRPLRQVFERRLQLRQPLLGPLADELSGDMQVGGRAPLNPCRGPEARHQRLQIADHLARQIEPREESHQAPLYCGFAATCQRSALSMTHAPAARSTEPLTVARLLDISCWLLASCRACGARSRAS